MSRFSETAQFIKNWKNVNQVNDRVASCGLTIRKKSETVSQRYNWVSSDDTACFEGNRVLWSIPLREEIRKPVFQGYASENSKEIGKPVSLGCASENLYSKDTLRPVF
ncbi:unnamed protein product [Rhizophagus irregularis]|nr:unnamed protein product [Rhizophagus irregularis]